MGYEAIRDETLARQKELGIVPPNTVLPPINPIGTPESRTGPNGEPFPALDYTRPWDSLSTDEQRLFCRMAEVYAGFLAHTDAQIGRLLDYLDESGQRENTMVILVSDNGASGEGGPNGSVNECKFANGIPDDIDENLAMLDELGSPTTYGHYPNGWAMAFNTPFKMWKRYEYSGGTSDPCIISWPGGMEARGDDQPLVRRGRRQRRVPARRPLGGGDPTTPRPVLTPARNRYVYYPGLADVPESQAANIRNRSYAIGALDIAERGSNGATGANGVLFAHGSRFGGHSLYVKDNRLHYVHSFVGSLEQMIVADQELPTGEGLILSAAFEKDGENPPGVAVGTLSLYHGDVKVGEGRIQTQLGKFSIGGDGLCIGRDSGDPATTSARRPSTRLTPRRIRSSTPSNPGPTPVTPRKSTTTRVWPVPIPRPAQARALRAGPRRRPPHSDGQTRSRWRSALTSRSSLQ